MATLNVSDLSALDSEVIASPLDNFGTTGITITGTWVGTINFYGSQDDTTYQLIEALNWNTKIFSTSTNTSGQFIINAAGIKAIKVKMTSYTSGTANVALHGNSTPSGISRGQTTLLSGNGLETGVTSNPLVTTATLSYAPELLNGRLFSVGVEANAASSSADNPLVLFRNPLDSGRNVFIYKIIVGCDVTNVISKFKIFGSPTLSTTAVNITNITQTALSTTVTVTTATSSRATVGATVVISGTTNFNGTYTVATVVSGTRYTFIRSAILLTQTETSGTSTVQSSLGTAVTVSPLKRVASPASSYSLVTSLPTVGSNGTAMIVMANGQNTAANVLVDSAQISLEPGQNILITCNPSSNNRSMTITVIWSEATV